MGARDNLTQGKSTFFVELSETSNILRRCGLALPLLLILDSDVIFFRCSSRSLVILDEVLGGLGLVVCSLSDVGCVLVAWERDIHARWYFAALVCHSLVIHFVA